MFIAALFTLAKLWKQQRYPTSDEQIKKMWYLYTREFYSVTKKNGILSIAGKWMDPENIILSEVRLKKPKIACSPSYADYRPKTNAGILLDTGQLRGDCTWEGLGKGRKPKI
jgi:hypothetical protein